MTDPTPPAAPRPCECPHCKHPIPRHGPKGCEAYREFTNARWPCRCDATHGTNHPPRQRRQERETA